MNDQNRKTNVPVKRLNPIVEGILRGSSLEELEFMADIAESRKKMGLLSAIFYKLAIRNIEDVFYEKTIQNGEQLMNYRSGKRGEVAGLKAFELACKNAAAEIARRREQK